MQTTRAPDTATTDRHVQRTVRRVRRRWRGLGVPRRTAGEFGEQLRRELDDAAAQELPVAFVVGDDLTAYAASRLPEVPPPDPVRIGGNALIIALLAPAMYAALTALLTDRPPGLRFDEFAYFVAIMLGASVGRASRVRRVSRAHARAELISGAGGTLLMAVGAITILVQAGAGTLAPVPLAAVVAAILAAVAIHVLLDRREQRRWQPGSAR